MIIKEGETYTSEQLNDYAPIGTVVRSNGPVYRSVALRRKDGWKLQSTKGLSKTWDRYDGLASNLDGFVVLFVPEQPPTLKVGDRQSCWLRSDKVYPRKRNKMTIKVGDKITGAQWATLQVGSIGRYHNFPESYIKTKTGTNYVNNNDESCFGTHRVELFKSPIIVVEHINGEVKPTTPVYTEGSLINWFKRLAVTAAPVTTYKITKLPKQTYKVGDKIRFCDVQGNIPTGSLIKYSNTSFATENFYIIADKGIYYCPTKYIWAAAELLTWNLTVGAIEEAEILYLPESK